MEPVETVSLSDIARTNTVAKLMDARRGVIETMDKEPLTRESAVAAIDAMAGETLRIIEAEPTQIMTVVEVDGKDDFVKLDGLANAYFDAINS